MSYYIVHLTCTRDTALRVSTAVAKIFGGITRYITDPLLSGEYESERVVVFTIESHTPADDVIFQEAHDMDHNELQAKLQQVHRLVPGFISLIHIITH